MSPLREAFSMPCRNDNSVAASIAAAALGLLLTDAACAEDDAPPDHPMMSDRYFVGVGALYAESDVTANLNTGRIGLGTFIDFEDDVGLAENNWIGLILFRMRLSERWRLEAEYFRLDRDNEKQLSRTIDWGNLSIPINAEAKGTFNVEDARVSVGYSFFRRKDKEIGVGLGAHVMSMEASLNTRNFGAAGASESAPLPVVTFYARMALTDRWLLNVRVDRLSLDTGDIDGSIFSSGTEFVYQPWRHFNIGLGYRDINMEVTSTSEDWRGKAQIRQSGPILFFSSTF
jgi:hypothetical protein